MLKHVNVSKKITKGYDPGQRISHNATAHIQKVNSAGQYEMKPSGPAKKHSRWNQYTSLVFELIKCICIHHLSQKRKLSSFSVAHIKKNLFLLDLYSCFPQRVPQTQDTGLKRALLLISHYLK